MYLEVQEKIPECREPEITRLSLLSNALPHNQISRWKYVHAVFHIALTMGGENS